jgi:hypothetical protein
MVTRVEDRATGHQWMVASKQGPTRTGTVRQTNGTRLGGPGVNEFEEG